MSYAPCPRCKGSWDHQDLEFSASQRKVGSISTSGENPPIQEEGAKWTRLTNTHYTHVLMDAEVMLLLVWFAFSYYMGSEPLFSYLYWSFEFLHVFCPYFSLSCLLFHTDI